MCFRSNLLGCVLAIVSVYFILTKFNFNHIRQRTLALSKHGSVQFTISFIVNSNVQCTFKEFDMISIVINELLRQIPI